MAKYLDSVGLSKAFELIKSSISTKQDALVSGTNIKTINNTSLLGSGNITVGGGGGDGLTFDDVYPVGAIYMSVSPTNPGTLFGGTWQQIEDMFLLAAGTSHAAGSTGGAEEVTLTTSQIPSHNHKPSSTAAGQGFCYIAIKPESGVAGSFNLQARSSGANRYAYASTNTANLTYYSETTNTGGGAAHNNMPPYLTVYMWKRTA